MLGSPHGNREGAPQDSHHLCCYIASAKIHNDSQVSARPSQLCRRAQGQLQRAACRQVDRRSTRCWLLEFVLRTSLMTTREEQKVLAMEADDDSKELRRVVPMIRSEGGTSGEVESLPLHRVSTEGGIRDSRWRPGGDPVETRENGGSSKWSQSTALPNCSTCSVDHGGDGHHVGGQPTSPGYSLSGDGGSPGYPPCLSIRDSQWTPVENQWRRWIDSGLICS